MYKVKTCTQIVNSGFRGETNVVNPGDSARRASPGWKVGFSHVNARLAQKHFSEFAINLE